MLAVIRHAYVVIIILVSFLVFHNDSLPGAWADIQALLGTGSRIAQAPDSTQMAVYSYVMRNRVVLLGIALAGSTPIPVWIWKRLWEWLRTVPAGDGIVHVLRAAVTLGLLVLCTAYLIDGSFNPFLYFRF